MKISIVVPVYKVEFFLSNCIESILNQTFNDFELILVDDGSPDKCGEICEKYKSLDSRIVVVHQKNQGLSAARNTGIELSKGEYLAFVDSDDFILPHYLENLLKSCEDENADMSACRYERCAFNVMLSDVNENSCIDKIVSFSKERMKVFFTTKKIMTTAWGKLYKKTLFKSVRYPIGRYNEDSFTTYLLVHFANSVAYCDYVGYVYRKNDNSIINESFSKKKMDLVDACVERALFVEKYYPSLKKYGYRSIIYSCNQVLLCMGKGKVRDEEVLKELQSLYRKYWIWYVFKRSSLFGKFFAFMAFFNVKIPLWFVERVGT